MNPIVDTIVIILFVLFMIFIFQGYHQSKYIERHGGKEGEDQNTEVKSDSDEDLSKK